MKPFMEYDTERNRYLVWWNNEGVKRRHEFFDLEVACKFLVAETEKWSGEK